MKGNPQPILVVSIAILGSMGAFANTTGNGLSVPVSTSDTGMLAAARTLNESGPRENTSASPLRFDATYGGNAFQIIWNTMSVKGCDHFVIERSFDGLSFEKLGEVKGIGPCSRKDNFFFKDHIRPTTARKNDFYYRVQQVESDGQSTYSKLLVARVYNSKSLFAMSITPDPDLNDILINVQLKENAWVVMKLADSKGNEIMRKSKSGNSGLNIFKLDDTSKLKPGSYSLEVIVNSNERMNMKLQKA